jgi:hypothetical protein
MAGRPKPQAPKQPLVVSSLALTPETRAMLTDLTQDVADRLGRTISQSAVMRALLRRSTQQGGAFVQSLTEAVEAELNTSILWGSRPKKEGGR